MEKTEANIEEKGHEPDQSDVNAMVHEHHARIGAIETHLGMKPQPGAAAEEAGKGPSKESDYDRMKGARKRH